MNITPQQWRVLSSLLDVALELDETAQDAWLAQLPDDAQPLVPSLRTLLAQRARLQTLDFLESPPDIAAALRSETARRQATPSEFQPGAIVSAYRLIRELGRGGMSVVWLAERVDGKLRRQVALKFPDAGPRRRQLAERLLRERDILASLEHPNIARLYDADVSGAGQPFLVLEHVDGIPIRDYCDQQRLSVRERLVLFLQVLNAVQYAHTRLVIHRDVKPSNILVTGGRVARLLDFGIAKLIGTDERVDSPLTEIGGRAFTPDYASPEQIMAEPLTTTSDIYSLGVVLHELLTGAGPYRLQRDSRAALEEAILTADVVAPSRVSIGAAAASARASTPLQLTRALRGDLDAIVLKALKKLPSERYISADAFARDIARYLDGEAVSAQRDSTWYRMRKFIDRHRLAVLGSGVAAGGLCAALVFALWQAHEAGRQRDQARLELRNAEVANDFTGLMLEEIAHDNQPVSRDQLIERGVQLLDARHGSDPSFVADMLTRLSRLYLDADRNNKAMELADRSIAIAREVGDPSLLALSLCNAAHIAASSSDIARARTTLAEAQRLQASVAAAPLHLDVECLRVRAKIALADGDYANAITLLSGAHARHVAEGVDTGLEYTGVLNDLGTVYFRQGRMVEVYRLDLEIGAAFDRGGRAGTDGRAIVRENLAVTLLNMGEPRAALAELDAVRMQRTNGDSHVALPAAFRINIAEALRRVGRPAEARSMIAGAAEELIASDSPSFATNAQVQEGAALIALGEREAGRAEIERAINVISQHAKARESALAEAQAFLADVEIESGQPAEAERRLEAFLHSAGYPQERAKLTLGPALASAARARLALGELEEAQPLIDDALTIAERTARGPETSEYVGEILALRARLQIAMRHPDEARPTLEGAIRCLTNSVGAEHPTTRELQALRASLK
jgi:serine/threonine-protein kinase